LKLKRNIFMASKKIYSLVALVGISAASGFAWWYQNTPKSATSVAVAGAPSAPSGPRAVGVEVAPVQKMTLRDDAQAVGSLRSRQSVMLRPEVAGRVVSLGFSDGARVSTGQLLVQLDDTFQRAEVQQSLAQMSVARANYKRNQDLVAQNFVAQRVLEESAAAMQVADAQLGLSCARLERMRIVAPFNGVVGIRTVNVGDYVKDGADLIGLEDIGMLYVDYRLPERHQAQVKSGQVVEVKLDAMPNRLFKATVQAVDPLIDANGRSVGVRAMLVNGPGEPVSAAGPAGSSGPAGARPAGPKPMVAEVTSNAALAPVAPIAPVGRGITLPTPQSLGCPPSMFESRKSASPSGGSGPLRPGMFARVTAVFSVKPNAWVVPEEAIVPQGGKQFVIKAVAPADMPVSPASAASAPALPEGTKLVSLRTEVKLGVRRAGQVEVISGLTEGDVVVVAGQQRLQKDGSALRVVEMGKPPSNPASAAASAAASSGSAPVASASR
jgi:membrane fusion protein (multidrug efflux system)